MRHRRLLTRVGGLMLAGVLALATMAGTAAPAGADEAGEREYQGTLHGAKYRAVVPQNWNGTLVVYHHGYYPPDWIPEDIWLATRPESARWLLDHGYALAASNYQGDGSGFQYEASRDVLRLLDWFDDTVGKPRRTVANAFSMGGQIAVRLAETRPGTFDGVLAQCADYDSLGIYNVSLDIGHALKTLLAPGEDIALVRPADPAEAQASVAKLQAAIERAKTTPEGRARLALAASLGNLEGWSSGLQPRPADPDQRIEQQIWWIQGAYAAGMGPGARPEIEGRAGGNPSWNTGVDYRRQLARSGQRDLVRWAYGRAGLDLGKDLTALNAGPKVAADPRAVAYFYRHGVDSGRTPAPVVSLHTLGDAGAIIDQQGWYTRQVARNGDPAKLRSMYVDRGGHCSFNAADELVAMRTLLDRVETGRWPSTTPDALNARAAAYGPGYQSVLDIATGGEGDMPPAFTGFTPSPWLRPSR